MAIGLVVWATVATIVGTSSLPTPFAVGVRASDLVSSGEFFEQATHTLFRVASGFLIAFAVSVLIAGAMLRWPRIEPVVRPLLLVILSVPALAWGIIGLMLFGIGETAAIFAVGILVAPGLAFNFMSGVRELDRNLNEMATAFRLGPKERLKHLILPQLAPFIFSATRSGVGLAWKVVVIVELLGLGNGIGYQIAQSFDLFSITGVLAWTLCFAALLLTWEYAVVGRLENRAGRWRVTGE